MTTISAEELAKIKQSHKAKDLQKIIDEEKNKKNDDDKKDENGSVDEGGDEDDKKDEDSDQNFISNLTGSNSQDKRNGIYQKLKDELGNVVYKLHKAIRPINTELRTLDNEVGGLEEDQKAIDKKNNKDVDVWDNRGKEIAQQIAKTEEQREDNNQSFIHAVKTGMFGGKKSKKAHKHMGQVNLSKAADGDGKHPGFVERISKLKEDRGHEQGGIGF